MKIKIKKGSDSLTYNPIDSWKDVTLEQWAKLVSIKQKQSVMKLWKQWIY